MVGSLNPDYSWTGVWQMSGVRHNRAPDQAIHLSAFPARVRCGVSPAGVDVGFILIHRLNWRYMHWSGGNLNNQG